jgi:hypothetical protein
MRSEFQFLQSEADEADFLTAFAGSCDALEKDSETQWFFRTGDCRIQLWRSRRMEDRISIGRISIATDGFGLSFTSSASAEALYTRMRSWLKKRYTNRLTAENVSIPGSRTSYRTMWLGPNARLLSRSKSVTLWSTPKVQIKEAAEPGATDNPDDAQRLREDH